MFGFSLALFILFMCEMCAALGVKDKFPHRDNKMSCIVSYCISHASCDRVRNVIKQIFTRSFSYLIAFYLILLYRILLHRNVFYCTISHCIVSAMPHVIGLKSGSYWLAAVFVFSTSSIKTHLTKRLTD